jgi:GMP synthase (glutamine-hydrolysing)
MIRVTLLPEPHNAPPLLVVRHVPWEGPHRILDSFADTEVVLTDLLDDEAAVLPPPQSVRGAIFMGGPMSVNDVETLPGLGLELSWLKEALALDVPVLGICLGAQLIAKAAGSSITPAARPEIGVRPVQILDSEDPLAAALAPSVPALHWHGEEFDLPAGAVHLARSEQTDVQAFRLGSSAWGLLFHLEVDAELLETWLDEPVMAADAQGALGDGYAVKLRGDLARLDLQRARRVFDTFAQVCSQRARQRALAV